MKYLIIHGSFGSPQGNWFPRLKEQLELLNQDVLVPQFPVDSMDEITKKGQKNLTQHQNLRNWLATFKQQVLPWAKDEKLIVVAHSLGPLFLLHALSTFDFSIDAGIFVSPFLSLPSNKKHWQIDLANQTFYNSDFNFKRLRQKITQSFVLYSDQDPYVPTSQALKFADKLGSSTIPVLGGKHLSSEFNQNEFPLVLELCKSRIKLTLYQKYLAHLSEYHPTDIVKEGKNRALFLPSSELAKEGTFHFRNLSKSSFCTLPVRDISYWSDEQSVYMNESRLAAARVPLTRVYIFERPSDLKNHNVQTTMTLDQQAGINVLYCFNQEIDIPTDKQDFGIWDDSYVCTVLHEGDETRFILDSSQKRLDEAHRHKNILLGTAKKFSNNVAFSKD